MAESALTIEQYFKNPMFQSKMSLNVKPILAEINNKYMFALLKYKTFETHVSKVDNNTVDVLIRVPSMKYDKMKYDVVVRIFKTSNELSKCNVKVFSNCPSFIFKYAYTFNKYGYFLEEYASKYEPEVFDLKPKKTNYFNIVSYEKSIVFAFKYISKIEDFDTLSKLANITTKDMFNKVLNQNEVLQYYNIERVKQSKLKQQEKHEKLKDKQNIIAQEKQRMKKSKDVNIKKVESIQAKKKHKLLNKKHNIKKIRKK